MLYSRFNRGHWVHQGAPCVSSGSSGVAAFIGVCPGGRRVHPMSLGSLGSALGVVGFIRGRWVYCGALRASSRCDLEVYCSSAIAGFIVVHPGGRSVRWVAWCAYWGLLGTSGVTGFMGVRPWGRLVHQGLLGSLGCVLKVVVFIWCAPWVNGFIRVRYVYWGAPLGLSGLSGIAGFIGVCTGGRRFHQGSLRSLGYALGVVGFILGHWGAPWG